MLVFPAMAFGQQNQGVCINCTDPSEKFDVNGKIRSRDIPLVTTADYVIVTNADGVHRKVLLSSLTQNAGTCPNFIRNESHGYFLKFTSPSSIQNPNNALLIQGKTFNPAGTYTLSNLYHFSYTNVSGSALNINNPFTVNFGTLQCNY